MSNPNIPNITPTISLSTAQTIPLLLASMALEELSLAHIMNAEAEKLQLVVGTLTPTRTTFSSGIASSEVVPPATVSLSNLLAIDSTVQRTLQDVIKKEMLLEFKFENILELISLTQVVPPPCGCQVTNEAGGPFSINRGSGNSTVTLNGVPAPGNVTYVGIICSNCTPTANFFTFDYNPPGQGSDFTFTATTFNVPNCPENTTVTITGQGQITAGNNIFGANPTYTLTETEQNFISLTITGNGNTFIATVNNLGVGEIVLSNCP